MTKNDSGSSATQDTPSIPESMLSGKKGYPIKLHLPRLFLRFFRILTKIDTF